MATINSDKDTGPAAIRERVLRSIALNRIPGLNFAGHFLGLKFDKVTPAHTVMSIADGAHCRDADGGLSFTVMAFLLDAALATITRSNSPPGAQMATLRMLIELTGATVTQPVRTEAKLLGRGNGDALHQVISSATLHSGDAIVAYAGGALVAFDSPGGVPLPLPQDYVTPDEIEPLTKRILDPHERIILNACNSSLSCATDQMSFIEHFWGSVPQTTSSGTKQRLILGPHVANRVGHAHGGIMAGVAAANAGAAAPAGMKLNSIAVWFISPGRGKALKINSRVLHAGRTTAVVRTEIKSSEGIRVVEAVSQHSAQSPA